MEKPTLTLTEVSEKTGIKRRTLYNQIKSGAFPVHPLPGSKPRRWSTADVDAWIAGTYVP